MHSVLKNNNKVMPLFIYDDGCFRFGVSRCNESQIEQTNKKTKEPKDMFMDYVKVLDDIKDTEKTLSDLKEKKQQLEIDLLNDPITRKVIEELNESQTLHKKR